MGSAKRIDAATPMGLGRRRGPLAGAPGSPRACARPLGDAAIRTMYDSETPAGAEADAKGA